MKYIKFLKEKIKGYSFTSLVRLELESFFFLIASIVPTTLGVFVRALLSKLFFKSCDGLAWIQPKVIIIHSDRLVVVVAR